MEGNTFSKLDKQISLAPGETEMNSLKPKLAYSACYALHFCFPEMCVEILTSKVIRR